MTQHPKFQNFDPNQIREPKLVVLPKFEGPTLKNKKFKITIDLPVYLTILAPLFIMAASDGRGTHLSGTPLTRDNGSIQYPGNNHRVPHSNQLVTMSHKFDLSGARGTKQGAQK